MCGEIATLSKRSRLPRRTVVAWKGEGALCGRAVDSSCLCFLPLDSAPTTSFSILRGNTEGHFDLRASELDNMQYSDLEEKCRRALRGEVSCSTGRGDRIFIVVSPAEAFRLRLVPSKADEPSCNLAFIEPWTSGISTTIQELLIKDCFRQTSQREGNVRLFVLERGQSLPSHVKASRDFWSGWSNLPANAGDYKSISIVIQHGAAPVVPSRSLSIERASIQVTSPLSRATSLSKGASQRAQSPLSKVEEASALVVDGKGEKQDEQEQQEESHQSPTHSLLPLQPSHFSSESNTKDAAKDSGWTKLTQLPGKRSKRGIRLPTLAGAAVVLRSNSTSCFKSGAVSPRVTPALLQARREKRMSRHPVSPLQSRTASTAWRRKRSDMAVNTALPLSSSKTGLNTSRTGIGGSFKRSNKALKRAAGYFGSRASFSVKTSEPPTPTTASISLAEMCSHLAESSVENLLCKESRDEEDSTDWREDTIAETTVEQVEEEVIGSRSIEVASVSSKRKGWLANGNQVTSIAESCDLEDDSQEVEICPQKQRETIILEDTPGKKALVEEVEEELYEPPKRAPRRSESITSLFKSALSSLTASPQKSPPRKNKWLGNTLKEQVHKLARSKSVSGKGAEVIP